MRIAFLSLLLLAACSANGPEYKEAPKGSLVIYKKYASLGMSAGQYIVTANGVECRLHPGSYFVVKTKPENILSSNVWDMLGTSRLKFNGSPDKTYFVRVDMNGSKEAAAIGAGLIGSMIAEKAGSAEGPFILTNIESEQAKSELRGLKQDCI